MAGVGPFAVPAGKKGVFVWANDLNPDSFASLEEAVQKNRVCISFLKRTISVLTTSKVSKFAKPFNEDGRTFISDSAKKLLKSDIRVDITPKDHRASRQKPSSRGNPRTIVTSPKTFNHYILNLPASAITFLPAFIGLYASHSNLFTPHTSTKLPTIHVYCFSTKSDDNKQEEIKICKEISQQIEYEMKPGDPDREAEVEIWDVRDVAPLKRMFCASFRLPGEVAFRQAAEQKT